MARKTGQSASPTARPRKATPFGSSKLQVPRRSGAGASPKPRAITTGKGGSTGTKGH